MAELSTYIYEPYVGRLADGSYVLVQLFRDPDSGKTIHAQVAFRPDPWATWGPPHQLEAK